MNEDKEKWFAAYIMWLDDCLKEYNQKYHTNRTLHNECPTDYDPDELVEFSTEGSAYPHNKFGGTGYVPNAVTPWRKSIHYML